MKNSVAEILQNNKILTGINQNWINYFQDVADFCLPTKGWQNTLRQKGNTLKFGHLYDNTAILSLQTLVAGMQSNFSNPASQWFGFQPRNMKLLNNKDYAMWFHEAAQIVYQTTANSNLYRVTKEFYQDCAGFGTSPIFSEKDPKSKVRYRSIPPREVNLEEDSTGRVTGVYWNFKLNAVQAFGLWGNKAGKAVMDAKASDKRYEDMEFLLYVGPRSDRDVQKIDSLNMPFKSCWISKKDAHLIEEGGFEEMPFHVGRWWKPNDDCFAYSPAMVALSEIKGRNAQKKTALRRAMKETDPALELPSKGYSLPLNLNPAALNYRDPKLAADNGIRAIGIGKGDFNITKEMMEDSRRAIEESFFVPLFRAFSQITKQMTVPEVQERIREGMVLLGPVVGEFIDDVFDPLLLRTFNMGVRDGWIPPPPPGLEGEDFDIVYLSPLARAQKEAELSSIRSFLGEVQAIGQIKPGAIDKINEDKTVDIIAKIRAINPEIIRSEREIEIIRGQRQEMEQKQMELDATHKAAAIVKTGAEAEKAMRPAA